MGGEKYNSSKLFPLYMGSPPHGRGKAPVSPIGVSVEGITPAWAGKSLSSSSTAFMDKDHPRMGGEKTKKIP